MYGNCIESRSMVQCFLNVLESLNRVKALCEYHTKLHCKMAFKRSVLSKKMASIHRIGWNKKIFFTEDLV